MPQTLANYNQSLSDNLNISSFIAVQKVYAFLNFKSSNFFFQIKYPHIKFVSLTQVRKNTVYPPYIYIYIYFWMIQLLFIETKHKLQRKTPNKLA